jgi:molybdopterin-containing oxidoreductase family iron-sulfur binding subunit
MPYLQKEEDITPGVSTYFATVCRECPAGCGIIVRTREGRALKAEGNPEHPVNAGKLCGRGQASMQGLYNPDRFRQPMRVSGGKYTPANWDDVLKEVTTKIGESKGDGVVYLGGLTPGTFDLLVADFLKAAGSASRVTYEALSYEPLRKAAKQTFGVDAVPFHDLAKAKAIVSFGADFLETWLSPVEYARQFGSMHTYRDGDMGRFTYVGPRQSLTGANADRWIASRPGQELAVALGVLNVIIADGLAKNDASAFKGLVAEYTPEAVAAKALVNADDIRKTAHEIATGGVALAGTTVANADTLAVVVNAINHAVGAVGTIVQFGPNQHQGAASADLSALIERMNKGEVKVLVVNDVNPAFTLPASAKWSEAVAKVPYVVALSPYATETTAQAHVVLASLTPYEQWNDYAPREGVIGLMQPVMRPVYPEARHPGDALLAVAAGLGAAAPASYDAYLRNVWAAHHKTYGAGKSFAEFFNGALQKGGVFAAAAPAAVKLTADAAKLDVKAPAIEGFALVAYPTIQFYDGRLANRPWMQEMPDPMTKIAWDSWVEINPKKAKELGVVNGDVLLIETQAGSLEVPAYVNRGIREDVVAIPVGQGHSAFGRYAGEIHSYRGGLETNEAPRGVNPLAVLPAAAFVAGAKVTKTGKQATLAKMQGSDTQHDREFLQVVPIQQVGMLAQKAAERQREYEDKLAAGDNLAAKRSLAPGDVEYRAQGQLGNEPGQNFYIAHNHPEHRWGMAIDLSSCIGCGACTVACYAENNIPIVGPELMTKGREMAWLWIERYYDEDTEDSSTAHFLPMLCQQCDNAPCETVCPVYATYHTPEGLNAQVYNRCVGTRYCGNNCPYKVRRFNWFDYDWPEPLHMQLNPDLSVRTKGVMEKCTFCVQRIRVAKETAREENRPVKDGDVVTACQQTCPTDAIIFGDLKDPASRVAQLSRNPRGYRVLEELNTQSAVTYLREVVHES